MFISKEELEEIKMKIGGLQEEVRRSNNYRADLETKVKALERYLKIKLHRDFIFEYKPIKLEKRND